MKQKFAVWQFVVLALGCAAAVGYYMVYVVLPAVTGRIEGTCVVAGYTSDAGPCQRVTCGATGCSTVQTMCYEVGVVYNWTAPWADARPCSDVVTAVYDTDSSAGALVASMAYGSQVKCYREQERRCALVVKRFDHNDMFVGVSFAFLMMVIAMIYASVASSQFNYPRRDGKCLTCCMPFCACSMLKSILCCCGGIPWLVNKCHVNDADAREA